MDSFSERKEAALHAMTERDRSKKGSVDASIARLLALINEHPDHYTTSSCGGRILLLHEPPSRRKNQYAWPYVTHEQAEAEPFLSALRDLNGSGGRVWLRMQTAIVHVACRDLQAAQQLLDAFYSHGWKRSGIFSLRRDVMVELLSVEGLDAPVMEGGRPLVSEEYLRFLLSIANEKLAACHEKLRSAEERVATLLASTD